MQKALQASGHVLKLRDIEVKDMAREDKRALGEGELSIKRAELGLHAEENAIERMDVVLSNKQKEQTDKARKAA